MSVHQILLFFTTLGMHSGFGWVMGLLARQTRQRGHRTQWIGVTAGFLLLIYFPSALVILRLVELPSVTRFLIVLVGLGTTIFPLVDDRWSQRIFDRRESHLIYPAVCMLVLASWCLATVYINHEPSGAPLALASTFAAIAALQRRLSPR